MTAITRPSWLPTLPEFVFTMPEGSVPTPSWSVHYIDVMLEHKWLGNVTDTGAGAKSYALMEINAWVNRKGSFDWLAQINTMVAMVKDAVGRTSNVQISDYMTNPSSPTPTNFLVRLGDIEVVATMQDPNPDIERKRILVSISWIQRIT